MGSKTHKHKGTHQGSRALMNVPANARYVGMTELDDAILERICKLGANKLIQGLYYGAGALFILGAGAYTLVLNGNPLVGAVIAVAGGGLIYQELMLPRQQAKRLGKQLDAQGKHGRRHICFFTDKEAGTVGADGALHTFPYSAIERVFEDDRIFALALRGDAGTLVVRKDGLKRGDIEAFGPEIRERASQGASYLAENLRHRKR